MMRNLILAGALGATLATQAYAAPPTVTIYVSCFRGPWEEVIWDRPYPIFIDSLMEGGYSLKTAQAVAERACRDRSLVNDPEAMLAEVRRLLKDVPRDGTPITR